MIHLQREHLEGIVTLLLTAEFALGWSILWSYSSFCEKGCLNISNKTRSILLNKVASGKTVHVRRQRHTDTCSSEERIVAIIPFALVVLVLFGFYFWMSPKVKNVTKKIGCSNPYGDRSWWYWLWISLWTVSRNPLEAVSPGDETCALQGVL